MVRFGHEVAVHHVDVQQVGDARAPGRPRPPSSREVGGQDRRRDLHRAHASGTPASIWRGWPRESAPVTPNESASATQAQDEHAVGAGGLREQERAAPVRRHGAPGGGSGDEVGRARSAAHASTPSVSLVGERAHRVHEHGRRAAPGGGRGEQVALQRRRARSIVSGCMRQRASGRRRSTPRPLHGASSSTRSNDRGAHRRRSAVGHEREQVRQAEAVTGAVDHARPAPAWTSSRDHRAVGRRRARRWRWPCRPARRATSATRSPGSGAERRPRPPGWPGPAVWRGPSRTAARRAGVADAAHEQRVGHQRAGLDLGTGRRAARRRARRRSLARVGRAA